MKGKLFGLYIILFLVLTGCGNKGPDISALPTLETASTGERQISSGYSRTNPTV